MISFKEKYRRILHIDLETYSSNDIKYGAYKYADADDFEIMLVGYAYDDDPVKVIDVASGQKIPDEFIHDIRDPTVLKVAHNATFERVCFSRLILGKGKYLDAHGWFCTMVMASMLGLPKSLKDVGNALGLPEEDKKKAVIGTKLISFFAVPQEPKRTNNYRKRNLPVNDEDKWKLYISYNINDVVAEREIFKRETALLDLTEDEYEMYCLDAKINDLGVGVDVKLCTNIQNYLDKQSSHFGERLKEITKLENPNSTQQMIGWLNSKGIHTKTIGKETVANLLQNTDDEEVAEVLTIMQSTKKTSVNKYSTMLNSSIYDPQEDLWKCHGTLQYCGASRTWRWAGRLIQTQNLPRNTIKFLKEVRQLVIDNDFESIEILYPNTMQIMSELIRTAMIPRKDSRFVVADYNAIESRVAAWLADEKWKLKAFEEGKGIYEATASKMFNIPIEKISHDSPERAKGKVAELAGQYQGGVEAYKRFGADKYGWSDEQIKRLVTIWRDANQGIVRFWSLLDNAVREAINYPGSKHPLPHGLEVQMRRKILFIKLPSGRSLAYQDIAIEGDPSDKFKSKIIYYGEGTQAKWMRIDTYGGKLFENIVQAIARDCLRDAMLGLAKENLYPRFHVHDEVIVNCDYKTYPDDKAILEHIEKVMADSAGRYDTKIPLRAAGYCCNFYLKD